MEYKIKKNDQRPKGLQILNMVSNILWDIPYEKLKDMAKIKAVLSKTLNKGYMNNELNSKLEKMSQTEFYDWLKNEQRYFK